MSRLYEEVAYLGFHLHWPYDQIMQMDHQERQRWVREVERIQQQLVDPV